MIGTLCGEWQALHKERNPAMADLHLRDMSAILPDLTPSEKTDAGTMVMLNRCQGDAFSAEPLTTDVRQRQAACETMALIVR
jgi:hypothetical protein